MQRRRAQVRLAQQGYRQRKEATVALLEQEAKDLRCSLESVEKLFKDFHGFMAERECLQGDVEAAAHLQETLERIRLVIAKSPRKRDGVVNTKTLGEFHLILLCNTRSDKCQRKTPRL